MAKPTIRQTRKPGRPVRAQRKRGPAEAETPQEPLIVEDEEGEDAEEDEDVEVTSAESEDKEGGGGDTPLSRYIRDLRKGSPLLTPKQEIELARQMAHRAVAILAGRLERIERALERKTRRATSPSWARGRLEAFIKEFNPKGRKGKHLNAHLLKIYLGKSDPRKDVMIGFLKADRQGAAIVKELIESNLRLVVSVAKKYVGLLPLPDLVQEGNIGLMHATPLFDYRRGLRFSTYATWWIRHSIGRAIADKGRTVRLPVHLIEAAHKIGKRRSELFVSLGRMPTDDEVAKAVGIETEKIASIRTWTLSPVSIDEAVSHDRDDPLGDFLAVEDEDTAPEWKMVKTGEEFALLRSELRKLKPIEQDVLLLRFGLADDEELTFQQIGDKYRLSRERIRQLQESGLRKLRRSLLPALAAAT